ncbi:CPBP family intramembrane glutamic endopeptidase [Dactylosporangium matsuzakiense]|uniref:CAAX amino protease n=1 Tax=Dactylosporangium matsuzakiense TaxID=53360 RepID=A0A9W6KG02_9ACTN|nr:CPBP family intramembrane glutamic endopeptidase [Dactylosporangium matsuzakiense]UWZ42510.1 CPBP family intramembrane metalloprotease [Dactylosporangium matsuzakiense]GLL00573.1 CAAX amino protease [Dactylosporangium matsuzakiense]
MRLILQLVVVVAVALAGSAAVTAADWNVPLTLGLGAATAVLLLLAYAWIVRRTEHRPVDELSPRAAGPRLAQGFVIGAGLFAAVIVNIAFLGGYTVAGRGSVSGAVALLGFALAACVTEELLFRGILFRIVEGWAGTWVALVLSSLLFGLSHIANPHATVWSALAVAVEAGAMLGAAYAATRTLWVPIGLHIGWNFAEGGIFGTDVSGTGGPDGLLRSTMSGPAALTGGGFGPEGSLYALAAGLLTAAVFLWLAHRRGRIKPRRGRRPAGTEAGATLTR